MMNGRIMKYTEQAIGGVPRVLFIVPTVVLKSSFGGIPNTRFSSICPTLKLIEFHQSDFNFKFIYTPCYAK